MTEEPDRSSPVLIKPIKATPGHLQSVKEPTIANINSNVALDALKLNQHQIAILCRPVHSNEVSLVALNKGGRDILVGCQPIVITREFDAKLT
jgi:hypothetical protein